MTDDINKEVKDMAAKLAPHSPLYRTFKTDGDLERAGIWLDYGKTEDDKDIRIKICRSGGSNDRFAKVLDAKFKPYRRALQMETLDNGVADKLLKEVFVETVILDWQNVQDENGQYLAFTPANVIKILTDLPELWRDLREQSGRTALFRQEVEEAAAKN